MNFSRFLDIQSWWEVPSIAYFCSLFRTAFNLLDFDIEELEEALLTDGTEDSGSSLLTELIVRLLNGCLGNNDISAFNYQMYLRRLFRQKCQESGRYNPFNTDIDFQFLPLRRKVEILYALCDFRLDAEDVFDLFKNLEAESLRVEPLGWDDNDSAYWYFYGTRLYREDIIRKPKAKKKKKNKDKKRGWLHGDEWNEDETERVWQVVCFTEEDWTNLTQKFSKATSKIEKELFRSLSQNFMPEIPRLFHEKERLQRKRLLELAPRRTSSRVLEKIRQKEEEESSKATTDVEVSKDSDSIESQNSARRNRAKRRNFLRSKSRLSTSDSSGNSEAEEMPRAAKPKKGAKKSKIKEDTENSAPQEPPIRTGRKTNNSLASATFQNDQIVIPDTDEPINSTRKKLKTSQIFSQTKEDIQTDMYKVLEQLRNHQDAWPFLDPVEEDYAPNYYSIIRRPMDLHTMEERLDSGYYMDFATFKADFKLIVSNCRLYNGQDNEYTMMVDNLQAEFDRLTEKYMYPVSSSDEEIAVEYQLPTPTRRQKRKASDSPSRVASKRKKHKSQSESGEPKCSTSSVIEDQEQEVKCDNSDNSDRELTHTVTEIDNNNDETEEEDRSNKISMESRNDKGKKRHRHGKHSKVHKKKQHGSKTKHSKKHSKKHEKSGKKSKQKKSKQIEQVEPEFTNHNDSQESLSSSNSRSASPLPSIHTPTPSPTEIVETEASKTHSSKCHNAKVQYLLDNIQKYKLPDCAVAKHIWKHLFGNEKTKKNLIAPIEDKNQKLRETIEKLKAKNKKCRDPSLFTSLFSPRSGRRIERKPDYKEDSDEDGSDNEPLENVKGKCNNRKLTKKCSSKSESTSEALEEAMKDISKWLEDMPEKSVGSSLESSAPSVTTEEQDSSSRQDYESLLSEKSTTSKKDFTRKRQSLRELKLVRKREIQRTIDRLQPGKSKGNLLTNFPKNIEDYVEFGDSSQNEETSPKLNLGSVLPTVDFQLSQECSIRNVLTEELPITSTETEAPIEDSDKQEPNETVVLPTQKDQEDDCEPSMSKPSQEKATPNLSAWFKAFGVPKTTVPPTSMKKKTNTDNEEKLVKPEITEVKVNPKNNSSKIDSPNDPNSPNHDGGDSTSDTIVVPPPLPRRTSTGSSVSEQSCLSQDLDSPRHQMSHTSPLLRSPASPRYYDGVIINGTVRAGFYQDTTSVKSSPDKICSPREAPQSPYCSSPLHVYAASAGSQGTIAPNYFVDPIKSPLLINTQNTSLFYEQNKATTLSKTPRLPTDTNQLMSPVSPDYSPKQPHYIPSALSPQKQSNYDNENKSSFPVKKRTYNEFEETENKLQDNDSNSLQTPRIEVEPLNQTLPAFSNVDNVALVEVEKKVEDNREIKYAKTINSIYENNKPAHVNNKPLEMTKKNAVDMVNMGYFISEEAKGTTELRGDLEYFAREREMYKSQRRYELDSVVINSQQLPKPLTKPNISTYNFTPAHTHERHNDVNLKQTISHAHQNPYESLASVQPISSLPFKVGRLSFSDIDSANKKLYSNNISSTPLDFGNWREPNQGLKQDPLPAHFPTATNSNGNEINSTNKKQYADNISSTPLDFGNWRDTDHAIKQDQMPEDFSANTNSGNETNLVNKKQYTNSISSAPLNFGYWKNPTPTRKQERVSANISTYVNNDEKNLQQQQYNNYALPRITSHKVQTNSSGPSELRIPNPRATMPKSDNTNVQLSATKKTQNNSFAMPYKNPYIGHSTLYDSMEPMRNLELLERHSDANERYLSTFANNVSLYQSKLFGKGLGKEITTPDASSITYGQVQMNSESQFENKSTTKRKWIVESKQSAPSQAYPATSCGDNILTPGKTSSIIPPTTFNFGSTTMSLGSMYGDNSGFSIENFRNSTTQLMAANYMAAAVANRNNSVNAEKFAQPAHQNNHGGSTYPFITHSQAPAGYPFVGTDASSPLYQQYIQRYQEELQRQTGAQIMGLYPPTYPPTLGVRQPYDSINRPSWI